jgi:SAM-dependent methyltransferase
VRPDEIKSHPAFAQPWYYVMELSPDVYTSGEERPNVGLTRRLLNKVDVKDGVRCLDVGSQEGLVSVLLERRGAAVVAYDRVYSEERLELVRRAFDTRFELLGEPVRNHTDTLWIGRGGPTPGKGMTLAGLRRELARRGYEPFDLVVFSGVLYHVYDPLASLALIRGFVRTGGLVVVETAAIYDSRMTLNLNAAARFTPLAIWLPSLGALDYLLRLVRLEPLEIAHFGRRRGRIAVLCRAVEAARSRPDDEFIGSPLHDYELAEYLDWSAVASEAPPIGYDGEERRRLKLFKAVRSTPEYRPEPHEKRLDLGARV